MADNKLEQNNLQAQNKLMNDIIRNYGHITYSVRERGKELMTLLLTRKLSDGEKKVTLTKQDYDKILDIVKMLQDESRFDQLGILSKSAVPDNKTKLEILAILQNI